MARHSGPGGLGASAFEDSGAAAPGLSDVTVEQICGPDRVLPHPQAEGFAVRFSTPGRYRFVLRSSDGELLQTGPYGALVANPYTVLAGRQAR